MNTLVSIIVPAYNVERYIQQCLESIKAQTYQNIEVIIIDDGSKDQTRYICDEFSESDKRFKVLHKINEGISAARNLGVETASGTYITFVDADDYIKENHIESLVNMIKKYAADLSITSHMQVKSGEKVTENQVNSPTILNRKQVFQHLYNNDMYGGYLWNKLFKAEIIRENNIFFPKNINVFEDMIFICDYLNYCKKTVYGHEITYYYVQHENSTLASMNYDKILQAIKARKIAVDLCGADAGEFVKRTKRDYILLACGYIKGSMIKRGSYDSAVAKELINQLREYAETISFPVKKRLEVWILCHFTYILCMVYSKIITK